MMEKYIYWLKEIHVSNREIVGGKAANMGDLARGLNVPEGFCLCSEAYYRNLNHYKINEKIRIKLENLDTTNLQAIDRVSAEIYDLIMETPFLPEIEDAVNEAFSVLAEGKNGIKVAVRSSATAEDLVDASFAGQQETYLDVEGRSEVLESIKKCWASLWTSRAIHYRSKMGFEHQKVKMAVIVQEMVPAVVSGVMFTANPVNNSRQEIRIEAVRGLGEQLVSGHTVGDIYILKKNDVNVEIVSKSISDPKLGPMLNDYDLTELAHTGLKIELFYGDFQDIEWAYWRGKFYFLQTRPITTLADEELPDIDIMKMNKLQREVMDWVAERFPNPVHPIDGIVVKVLFLAQFEAMVNFGYKIGDMDWKIVDSGIFPEFFIPPQIKSGWKRFWLYLRLIKILRSDPAREWAKEEVHMLEMLRKLKGRDIGKLPMELITDYITEAFNHFHYFMVMRYTYFVQQRIPSIILGKLINYAFKEEGREIYENLLAGSENATITINRALHNLALDIRMNSEVKRTVLENPAEKVLGLLPDINGGNELLEKLSSFLDMYGERETTMGLGGIASPTWQDEPEVVIGILQGMLSENLEVEAKREEARHKKKAEAEKRVKETFSKGIYSLIMPLVEKMIIHSKSFTAFRENSHYDVTKGIHVFRLLYTELGRRFEKLGYIKESSDLFYLNFFEIREIISTVYHGIEDVNVKALSAKLASRRVEQERRMVRWELRNKIYDHSGVLQGISASQGLASGPARIIRDPHDFHKIRQGDILVAPYTNPAWTPLFTTIAALVAETGGPASHAAIIAREYGIPAVMGVAGAVSVINEGQIITVNGSRGIVVVEKE
jgi:phosphohistidine swiveling domain-containing protein